MNPHKLGTRDHFLYENDRHKNTAFGSWHDRSKSLDLVLASSAAYRDNLWKNLERFRQ